VCRAVELQPMSELKTVEWVNGRVRMIDQTRIPYRFTYVTCKDYHQVAKSIKDMVVRGAPAIGVAAAMGMALAANANRTKSNKELTRALEEAAGVLRKSRPTAWNLFWAVDRVLQKARSSSGGASEIAEQIIREAQKIAEEDIQSNHKIGDYGAALLHDGDQVLTHCNTGTFATVSYGTALAPIRTAVDQGKKIRVVATETRPRLQGAKLTTFELLKDRIPVTLIVDGAAGYVMEKGMVQAAIVGADRITARYVANKVGTYLIGLAAQANGVPLYVAAPWSTFDLRQGHSDFKIEERNPQEVTHIGGKRIAPKGVVVFNPAFDLTPIELVKGFITDRGVLRPEDLGAQLPVPGS
jgi:methylthioribose-1-phosphate isomerase